MWSGTSWMKEVDMERAESGFSISSTESGILFAHGVHAHPPVASVNRKRKWLQFNSSYAKLLQPTSLVKCSLF